MKILIENINESGIYCILNMVNNNCYIGSAVKLSRRLYRHKSELKTNKHSNNILQNAINKYGFENFEIKCIEYCKKEDLIKREQYYLDLIKPKYNIRKICANNNLGVKLSDTHKDKISKANKGKIRTSETRLKIREVNLGRKATLQTLKKMSEWQKGKAKSETHRKNIAIGNLGKKMSKSSLEKSQKTKKEKGITYIGEMNPNSKLSSLDVVNIRKLLLNESVSKIALTYNVSYQTIWGIMKNKYWKI